MKKITNIIGAGLVAIGSAWLMGGCAGSPAGDFMSDPFTGTANAVRYMAGGQMASKVRINVFTSSTDNTGAPNKRSRFRSGDSISIMIAANDLKDSVATTILKNSNGGIIKIDDTTLIYRNGTYGVLPWPFQPFVEQGVIEKYEVELLLDSRELYDKKIVFFVEG
ncbi:MAG: hypothetical protein V3W31_09675 [Thermodesulfobacteriota bacterium]